MNREQFLEKFKHNQEQDLEIVKTKNQDYADGGDPFQNFKMVQNAGLMTVEKGIAVRMSDKMQRIFNLINEEAAVEDETIEDTLSDLRNYANILQIYLQQKGQKPENKFKIRTIFEGVEQEANYVNLKEPFTPLELRNGENYYCYIEENK